LPRLRAFTLEDAGQGRKLWGLAVQLYALRRQGDGGIGDFAALADLAAAAARPWRRCAGHQPGARAILRQPGTLQPLCPSSRAALNALHIAEPGEHEGGTLIDWPLAGAAKLRALRQAYQHFHDHEKLDEFRREAGDRITRHALFEAIQAALVPGNDSAKDWRNWPQAYRDPQNPAALRFLQDHAHEVGFHAWLQYRADTQLAQAQRTAREAGMRIGLIGDLAVGMDPAGSHAWSRQNDILLGLTIGAPPDLLNPKGQDWGLTGFSPPAMEANGFAPFLATLRAAMRHVGGIRIDHAMGLARLWLIPEGATPADGAYPETPRRRSDTPARARIAAPPGRDHRRGSRYATGRVSGKAQSHGHFGPARHVVRADGRAFQPAFRLDPDRRCHEHHA
jgi:4-alpha-glucanotransferase